MQHANSAECLKNATKTLQAVSKRASKWVGICVEVQPNGELGVHATTCDFDLHRTGEVVERVAELLAIMRGRPEIAPLPIAPEFAVVGDEPAPAVSDESIGEVLGELAPSPAVGENHAPVI